MTGIQPRYVDGFGKRHAAPPETVRAIEHAIEGERRHTGDRRQQSGGRRTNEGRTIVTTERCDLDVGPSEIRLEDGSMRSVDRALPRDLPVGYHRILQRGRTPAALIVAPPVCYLPPAFRAWGWAIQLYAARSRRSWGIGDLADLRWLGRWGQRPGRRHRPHQPVGGGHTDAAAAAQPVLSVEPPLSQPAVPAHRRGRRRARPGRSGGHGRERARAQSKPRNRPRRRVPPEVGGARSDLGERAWAQRRSLRSLSACAARPRTVRRVLRARRTVREPMAAVAGRAPTSRLGRGGPHLRANPGCRTAPCFTSGRSFRSIANSLARRRRCR